MARIALFVPDLRIGGAERVVLNLANEFVLLGHEVAVVLMLDRGEQRAQLDPRVQVFALRTQQTLLALQRFVVWAHRWRPESVLSALDNANTILAVARRLIPRRTKLFASHHSDPAHHYEHPKETYLMKRRDRMRRLYPHLDGIIAVSPGVGEALVRIMHVPESLVHVIVNPVITRDFFTKANEALPFPVDRPFISAVGRLHPAKDFPTLVRAFDLIADEIDVDLRIIGDGIERPKLEAMIAELGRKDRVSLPGFLANPLPVIRESQAFAFSSVTEGFGIAVVEALALQKSIVSTDCPTGPREILHDGEYGALVPVGSPEAMALALRKAVKNPSPSIPDEAWQPYTIQAIGPKYLQVMVGNA